MPTVFREDSLAELSAAAKKTGHIIKAHIKVDTGMHRIGIAPNESGLDFVEKLLATEGVELEGIFTHFARADEFDKSDALRQNKIFRDFVSEVEERFQIQISYKHSANSAGILELKDSYLDLVRAGVALYGMWPSEEVSKEIVQLKPALSLYSHVVYIKEIRKGDAVSYGGTFVAEKNMRVATIPVGYGDGYPRSLSGKGYVLIRGKKAPILGRVCMDQFMVDVTEIPEAQMDDLVTLIGTDGDLEITIEELGDISGRFNYELACDLGKRIPRVYNL
jgi:alanine racemase